MENRSLKIPITGDRDRSWFYIPEYKDQIFCENLVTLEGQEISINTWSRSERQKLYFTHRGNWVLHKWSTSDEGKHEFTALNNEKAADWILLNGLKEQLSKLDDDQTTEGKMLKPLVETRKLLHQLDEKKWRANTGI